MISFHLISWTFYLITGDVLSIFHGHIFLYSFYSFLFSLYFVLFFFSTEIYLSRVKCMLLIWPTQSRTSRKQWQLSLSISNIGTNGWRRCYYNGWHSTPSLSLFNIPSVHLKVWVGWEKYGSGLLLRDIRLSTAFSPTSTWHQLANLETEVSLCLFKLVSTAKDKGSNAIDVVLFIEVVTVDTYDAEEVAFAVRDSAH